MKLIPACLVALIPLLMQAEPAAPRAWTTVKGAQVTASVERVENGLVLLQIPGGRSVSVRLFDLSAADRGHLEELGLAKQPELRTWTSASGQRVEARLLERKDELLTLEDAAGRRIGVKLASLSFADRQVAVHGSPVPAARLLAGTWRGYAVDVSGQVYQHELTIKPGAGGRWTAEGTLATTLSARQVALARGGKAVGADAPVDSHALKQWFDVSLSNDTVVLQGTRVDLFFDRRDTKGEYKPDRFVAELSSPGLMVGTWPNGQATNHGFFFASLPGVLALPPPLTLERGRTHKLVCAGATNLHYTLYIPNSYDPSKPAPLLVNDSPSANGQPLSTKMAEETGWIMAGLTESQNNANWWVCQGNCAGALFDIQRRLNIDATRVYFSGFSGGSRRASLRALDFPDMTAGLICIGAGFAQWSEGPRQGQYHIPPAHLPIYFIVGQTDMNNDEVTERVHPVEVQRKRPVELVIHPGGHTWGRPEDHEAAIRWLIARGTNTAPPAAGR